MLPISEIVALAVLSINVLWDSFCLGVMFVGFVDWVPHWNLWAEEEDRLNPATQILFAALVGLNGSVRLLVMFSYPLVATWWPAVATYAVEVG